MSKRPGAGSAPSMQNVAAYAGVSIATVSKVMQGDASVRSENVVAVQNAIEARGYRITPVAAELRRGRRKLIGVVVRSLDAITAAVVRAIERTAGRQGYAIWVGWSEESEEREAELIGRLKDWRVAGFIVMAVREESGSPAPLLLDGAPAVFVDAPEFRDAFDFISLDAGGAAAAVRRRLAASAHRRVTIIGKRHGRPPRLRLRNALQSQLARGDFDRILTLDLDDDPASSAAELASHLDSPDRPTSIVALWRPAEFLVASHAAVRGWTDPKDLSLVGLGTPGSVSSPGLSLCTIEYPAELVGARAVELLLRRLEEPRGALASVTEAYSVHNGVFRKRSSGES